MHRARSELSCQGFCRSVAREDTLKGQSQKLPNTMAKAKINLKDIKQVNIQVGLKVGIYCVVTFSSFPN